MPDFENMTREALEAALSDPATPAHERQRAGEVWAERFGESQGAES